jgi:hypothetical protein
MKWKKIPGCQEVEDVPWGHLAKGGSVGPCTGRMFHGVCCEGRFYVAKKWKNVPWGHDVKERSMFPKSGRIFHEAISSKKVPCDHILKNVPWGNVGKEGHIWPCRRRVFHVDRRGKIFFVVKLGGRFRQEWKKPCTWRMFHMAMNLKDVLCCHVVEKTAPWVM